MRQTAAIVVLALVPVTGCREPAPPLGRTEAPGPTGMPLDNTQFSILEMATAHGAFTIEVEVDADADTQVISRQLIEPIHDLRA